MHTNANTTPASGLRRRVIIELTPQELPLLTAAEERHGTKRTAIIAALRAEHEHDALTQHLTDLQDELAKAETAAADKQARQEEVAALNRELTHLRATLKTTQTERDDALDQLADQHERLDRVEEAAEADYRTLTHQIQRLEDSRPQALYCAHCRQWAPETDWAWTTSPDGAERAHHAPCGDHSPGLLDAASWLALRNQPPRGAGKLTR